MSQSPNDARRSFGGRSALVGLALACLTAWLWIHSRRHGDALFLFGPGGKIGGVVSLEGQLLIGATNIPLGPSRAWTAQTVSTSLDEMRRLRQAAMDTASRKQGGRFAVAANVQDAFGVKGGWCRLVGVPHWLVVLLGLTPGAAWARRRWGRRRRRVRGRCVECGYDLRGARERCPECGAEILGAAAVEAPPQTQVNAN
jgi:hypothetical protein